MRTRTIIRAALIGVLASALLVSPASADTTVKVTADGQASWRFGRDPGNVAPWALTTAQASIGNGSLSAGPIGAAGSSKFIAELFAVAGLPTTSLQSVGFDFMISAGAATDAKHFYLNVNASRPLGSAFGDCRFDGIPASAVVGQWKTVTFSASTLPLKQTRSGPCPSTLAGMPAGSTITFISLNLGDTSTNDVGRAGYFDNVRVATASGTTVYDFDVDVDADDDGIEDAADNCPSVANADQLNFDADAAGDACDADDDGDGVSDDDDAFPYDPSESADSDGDGVGDNADAFPNDPTETADTDDDGLGDNADTDSVDDCKNGGWRRFTNPVFRNQGQCVSHHVTA